MDTVELNARAEFHRILARCFMPPTQAGIYEAMKEILADELRVIAVDAGYCLEQQIAAYVTELPAIADPQTLLQVYSALFLTPPRRVHLNASIYFDGTILGRSADEVETFYRKYAVQRAEDFKDIHDHLSAELEFAALLLEKAAETTGDVREAVLADYRYFNARHLLSWIPNLRRHLELALTEDHQPALFLRLIDILLAASSADAPGTQAVPEADIKADTAIVRKKEPGGKMVACRKCGAEIASAARIRRVMKVLQKEGVGTDHLELCWKCRGGDLAPVQERPAA